MAKQSGKREVDHTLSAQDAGPLSQEGRARRNNQSRSSMPNVAAVSCDAPSTKVASSLVSTETAEHHEENLSEQERKFMRLLERVQSKRIDDQRAHFHSERSKNKLDRQCSGFADAETGDVPTLRNSKSAHKMQATQGRAISARDSTFFEALVDSQMTSRYNDQRCAFLPKHRCVALSEPKPQVCNNNVCGGGGGTDKQNAAAEATETTKPKDSNSTSECVSNDPSCSKSKGDESEDEDLMSMIWRLQSTRLDDQRARLPTREASGAATSSKNGTATQK